MRIKRLAALGVAMCALSAWGQNNTVDEVIWLVGDDPILRSDVEAERLNAELSGQQVDESSFCNIAEMIAVQKLFLHQADIDSIEVSETEVIAEVNNRENLYLQNFGSKESIEQFTKKTMRQLRESWKEPIRNGLRMRNMQEKLVGNLKVTPAEVREYFKHVPEDSLPTVPTQVEVQISHEQGVEKDGDKDVAPLVETFLHPVQFPQGLVGVVALVEQFVVNFPQASGLERLA